MKKLLAQIPVTRFVLNATIPESLAANAILGAIQAAVFADRDSVRGRNARSFLLESRQCSQACKVAGIDLRKLRRHLRRVLRVLDRRYALGL